MANQNAPNAATNPTEDQLNNQNNAVADKEAAERAALVASATAATPPDPRSNKRQVQKASESPLDKTKPGGMYRMGNRYYDAHQRELDENGELVSAE